MNVEVMVVSGGAGGAFWYNATGISAPGGGGGAGGVYVSGVIAIADGTAHLITVGGGGAGGAYDFGNPDGLDGGVSNAFGLQPYGGGGGGGNTTAGPSFTPRAGRPGGSGGGGGGGALGGGAYVAGQGNSGNITGSGGGGGGWQGQGDGGGLGGPGGAVWGVFAVGGGGAGSWGSGTGGYGGGGNYGVAGVHGTGGGGGARANGSGMNGGNGRVAIRYPGGQTCTGGTVTSSGGYTIHYFDGTAYFNTPAAIPTIHTIDNTTTGAVNDVNFVRGTTAYTHVWGTNIASGAYGSVSGTGVTAPFAAYGDTTLVAVNVTVAIDAPLGARTFQLINPSGYGSNGMTIYVVAPAPTISSVTPTKAFAGVPTRAVFTGTNFIAPVSITNGEGVTVSNIVVVNETTITCDLVGNGVTGVGFYVTTPYGTSNQGAWQTLWPPPILGSVTPPTAARGTTVAATLTGSNFIAGSTTVAVSGSGVTVTGVNVTSPTSLTCNFVVDSAATMGNRTIAVTTPSGTSDLLSKLSAYWSLDEASGQALDAHGTNPLTAVNAPGAVAGRVAGARNFVMANSQYFSHASNPALQLGDYSFSYSVWVYPVSLADGRYYGIVTKDSAAAREHQLDINGVAGNSRWHVFLNGGAYILAMATGITINAWHHLVCGYDKPTETFWITLNNGPRINDQKTGVPASTATEFQVGYSAYGAPYSPFDGRIDEVGFWKKGLMPAEIAWLYNGGNGRSYASLASATPSLTVISSSQMAMII